MSAAPNEGSALWAKSKELERAASTLTKQARAIAEEATLLEAKSLGLSIGQTVEGYLHVDTICPGWERGVIAHFFALLGEPCATLVFPDGNRRAFYFKSVRIPKEVPVIEKVAS